VPYKIIVSMKARGDFTIVLSKDGFIFSWGSNSFYQLGDGTTVTRNVPVAVLTSNFLPNTVITMIGSGYTHAFAYAAASNTYYSWGSNNAGQLGNGSLTAWTQPVNASAISTIMSYNTEIPQLLYGGYQTTFVWSTIGNIYAFGFNQNGQLSESSTTTQLFGNNVDTTNFNGSVLTFCTNYQSSIFITNNGYQNYVSLSLIIIIISLFI